MRRAFALLLVPAGILAGCTARRPPAMPHYELGGSYQAAGFWHYPREEFARSETGLAEVIGTHAPMTADGEAFDQTALAASHPTLQLPALARLTNLDNGRSVVVRINDRGPASPWRAVGITRRTAELLAAADPKAIPVRLEVLEDESRRMAAALRPESTLDVARAPRPDVQVENLAAPDGARQSATQAAVRSDHTPEVQAPAAAAVPLRLPEAVTQFPVRPHDFTIECAAFSRADYANLLRGQLQSLGAVTVTDYAAPRDRAYIVRIPGIATAAAADALLQQARSAGATDARIVVE